MGTVVIIISILQIFPALYFLNIYIRIHFLPPLCVWVYLVSNSGMQMDIWNWVQSVKSNDSHTNIHQKASIMDKALNNQSRQNDLAS